MEVGAGNTWPCYRNAVRTAAVRAPRTSNFLKSRAPMPACSANSRVLSQPSKGKYILT